MTPLIPIFRNEINALGDFRGGVKVARDFAYRMLNIIDEGIVTAFPVLRLDGRPGSQRDDKNQLQRVPSSREIIHQAICFYLRFTLSFRDVEDLLAKRGITVSYETIRRWVNHFGPMIAADLRRRRPKPHTTWHLDEAFLKINGRWSTCGVPSTPKARSSMSRSNRKGTSGPR